MARKQTSNSQMPITTDSTIPVPIQRSFRRLEDQVSQLNQTASDQQTALNGKLGNTPSDLLSLADYMRNALQATGTHPLSILNLPGSPIQPPQQSAVTFSGDVTGTTGNQRVVGIEGRPVSSAAPSNGEALVWNGSQWTPTHVTLAASAPVPTATGPPAGRNWEITAQSDTQARLAIKGADGVWRYCYLTCREETE